MSDSEQPEIEAPAPRRRWGRTLVRVVLLIVIPVIAVLTGSYWYAQTGRYVSTENAYVKSPIVAVSTDIDGRTVDVLIKENQLVKKGDLLFRLDPKTHELEIDMAHSARAKVRNDVMALRAEYSEIEAEISESRHNVKYYQREAKRQRQLARKGVTTSIKLDAAEFSLTSARQQLGTLRQKLKKVLAELGGDPASKVERYPGYMEAEADLQMAKLNLSYTEIRAPVDGVITRLRLEPGEWVEEGAPAFGIIATGDAWVEANLKETQLTHVREGQLVDIEIDAYPDLIWKAKVSSISPATGAEFAVLPPQNASGNWVKVVQRLPVRLDFAAIEGRPPLRAGMTASISLDTGHQRELLGSITKALASFGGDKD